jgi:hypothetical protein
MFAEITIASVIIYFASVYANKPPTSNKRMTALLQPLDYSVWKSERQIQTKDSKDEVEPQGDWWQVQNEILQHAEPDYKKPLQLDTNDGYYVGDRSQFDPINYGI